MAATSNACTGELAYTDASGTWPAGLCPDGYHAYDKSGNKSPSKVCCRNCGHNRDTETFPLCVKDGDPQNRVVCPGAEFSRWVNESNALESQREFVGLGYCVDDKGVPVVPPGCGAPTSCAYLVRSRTDRTPTANPPVAYYPCSSTPGAASCVVDSFECDEKAGKCVASLTGTGPPLAVCSQSCAPPEPPDEPLYRCDAEAGECVQVDDGSGKPLRECVAEAACRNDPNTRYVCHPAKGCSLSTAPDAMPADECNQKCTAYKCTYNPDDLTPICGYSTNPKLKEYPSEDACKRETSCGGNAPTPPSDPTLAIVCVTAGVLALLFIVGGVFGVRHLLRRRKMARKEKAARVRERDSTDGARFERALKKRAD